MIFGIYSFHVFMLEGVDFRQAYKKSAAIVKKHFVGTLGSLVMYNLGVLVIIGIFYVLISAVLIAGVKLLAWRIWEVRFIYPFCVPSGAGRKCFWCLLPFLYPIR